MIGIAIVDGLGVGRIIGIRLVVSYHYWGGGGCPVFSAELLCLSELPIMGNQIVNDGQRSYPMPAFNIYLSVETINPSFNGALIETKAVLQK